MGKMAGVIGGLMNLPSLRFVPSKKEKRKKKRLDPFANIKNHGGFLSLSPFLCF